MDTVSSMASQNPDSSDVSGDRSTHFIFQHKVFGLAGAHFSLTHDSREPVFHVQLGELTAALPLPTLRDEFSIATDSPDGKLIGIVEDSLRYVKEIWPNDSIPNELLDGSASWAVEERHRAIARARLAVQLSSWLAGEEVVISDLAKLEQLAEDPGTKQRMQNAIGELAEKLGYGRDNRQRVVDQIEQFARELSYIEALRELAGQAKLIYAKLNKLSKLYSRERSVTEEIVRILQLMRGPLAELDGQFGLVDAQTSEIMNILRKYDAQVAFVRETRDELHFRLRDWDEMIKKWQEMEMVRSSEAEALIKESYRFVAYHFPQHQSWRR